MMKGNLDRSMGQSCARLGSLLALSVLAAFGAWIAFAGSADDARDDSTILAPLDDSPLPGGAKVSSMPEAMARFEVPLFRPDTATDSDATVSGIWVRTEGSPETYILYRSGLAVTIRPANEGLPTQAWADAQTGEGVPGEIIEVGGLKAFLVAPTSEGDGGSIRFVLDGALIAAIGPRGGDASLFTPTRLIDLAESIIASAPEVKASEPGTG